MKAKTQSAQPTAFEPCPQCEGCGKTADNADRDPWTRWAQLPLESSAAVVMGIVRPITCETCGGSGHKR